MELIEALLADGCCGCGAGTEYRRLPQCCHTHPALDIGTVMLHINSGRLIRMFGRVNIPEITFFRWFALQSYDAINTHFSFIFSNIVNYYRLLDMIMPE